jgi:superfamily I DNA/RNA helicase
MPANRFIGSGIFTWADAGIRASGRVINRKFDLDRNYRNTAEILRAARGLCANRKRHAGRARLAGRAEHRHPLRA